MAIRLRSSVRKLASAASPAVGSTLQLKSEHLNIVVAAGSSSDELAKNAIWCDAVSWGSPAIQASLPTGLDVNVSDNTSAYNASLPIIALLYTTAGSSLHEPLKISADVNAMSSPMVSFSLMQQGTELQVAAAAARPIRLTIPFELTQLAGAPADAECRWHHPTGWRTDGCVTIVDSWSRASCSCEHLTDFTIFSVPRNASDYSVKLAAKLYVEARLERAFQCRFNVEDPNRPPELKTFGWVAAVVILGANVVLVPLALLRDAIYERSSARQLRYVMQEVPTSALTTFCTRHVMLAGLFLNGLRGYTRGQTVQLAMSMLAFETLVVSWLVTPHEPPFTTNGVRDLVIKGAASGIIVMLSMMLFIVAFHPEIFVSLLWSHIKAACFFVWVTLAPCRKAVHKAYRWIRPKKVAPAPPPPPNQGLRLLLEAAKRVEERKWDKREQLAAGLIAAKEQTLAPPRGEACDTSEPTTPNSTGDAEGGIAWTRSRPCMSRPVTADGTQTSVSVPWTRSRSEWTPSIGWRGGNAPPPGGQLATGLDGVSRPSVTPASSIVGGLTPSASRQSATPMSTMSFLDGTSRPASAMIERQNVTPMAGFGGLDGVTPPGSSAGVSPRMADVNVSPDIPKLSLKQFQQPSPASEAGTAAAAAAAASATASALAAGPSVLAPIEESHSPQKLPPTDAPSSTTVELLTPDRGSDAGPASPPPSPPMSLASIAKAADMQKGAGADGHRARIGGEEEEGERIEYTEEMQEALRQLKGDFSQIKDPVVRAGLERLAADKDSKVPEWKRRRKLVRKWSEAQASKLRAAYQAVRMALRRAFFTVPNPYRSSTPMRISPSKRQREIDLLARQYVSRAIRRCDITALLYITTGWALNWSIVLSILYASMAYSCELDSYGYPRQADLAWTFLFSTLIRNCVLEPLLAGLTIAIPWIRATYFSGPNFVG